MSPLQKLLSAAALVAALLACGCGPQPSRRTSDRDLEPLLARLVTEGDTGALLAMARQGSVARISEALRSLPRGLAGIADDTSAVVAQHVAGKGEGFMYDLPSLILDGSDQPQVAFVSMTTLDRKDCLGNTRSWRVDLFHARRGAGGWQSPETILQDSLYVNGVKLLTEPGGTVHLLCYGHNLRVDPVLGGLLPRKYGLFHCSRPKDGRWSAPRNLLADGPSLLHDSDACFDDAGRLHLVWAAYKDGQPAETIQYRRLTNGAWSEEEILPALPGRSLTHPVIRPLGNGLQVFASGQTQDYHTIGLYRMKKTEQGWGQPELLLEDTGFEHPAAPTAGPGRTLLAVLRYAKPLPDRYVLFEEGDRAVMKRCAELPLIGNEYTPVYGWSLPSLAWDSEGRPLALVAETGNLYLIRLRDGGEPEAILVRAGTSAEDMVRSADLAVLGHTFHAVWAESRGHRRALRHYHGDIPREGWRPLGRVFWGTRAGVGLTSMDRSNLTWLIRGEAQALEREDLPAAVERYVYALGNSGGSLDGCEIQKRLKELDQAGIREVRIRVAKFIKDCPEVLETKSGLGWQLGELARELGLVGRKAGS